MKNFVPLILAVLLGLAAVLAVSRLIKVQEDDSEATTAVVAAARDINEGEILTEDALMKKVVPTSSRPGNAIGWENASMLTGQKALHKIYNGDYVMNLNVGFARSMSTVIGEGEWAVAVTVEKNGIASVITPGDQVAIMGTFDYNSIAEDANTLASDLEAESRMVTMVLFPRVTILDMKQTGAEGVLLIVSLPPEQSEFLVTAQQRGPLHVALRRPGDDIALSRSDVPVVDHATTFEELLTGSKTFNLPNVPGPAVE
jgi:Flp pilus assembly protein CpaB